jgi:NAD(P)H dehydrogenase (quinone)
MRVLFVFCRPLLDRFHAAIRTQALAGEELGARRRSPGPLWGEGFDPVLSAEGWRPYHDQSTVLKC